MTSNLPIGWVVFITVVVFLIVFFVAWGLKVRPLSAVALACIWTVIIQGLLFTATPTSNEILNNDVDCWAYIYWILGAAFIIYLIFYVNYVASKDNTAHMFEEENVMEKL